MTQKELLLATPYDDRASWRRLLASQLRWGTCYFRGPPGLLERMERLLSKNRAVNERQETKNPRIP